MNQTFSSSPAVLAAVLVLALNVLFTLASQRPGPDGLALDFHEIIHHMASSRVMTNLSRLMWDLSDFLINTTGAPQPLAPPSSNATKTAGRIISALHARDSEATKNEMENHILSTATIIQQARTASLS
jgi:DNA-binding FadR family transcriptional regulator